MHGNKPKRKSLVGVHLVRTTLFILTIWISWGGYGLRQYLYLIGHPYSRLGRVYTLTYTSSDTSMEA